MIPTPTAHELEGAKTMLAMLQLVPEDDRSRALATALLLAHEQGIAMVVQLLEGMARDEPKHAAVISRIVSAMRAGNREAFEVENGPTPGVK